MGLQYGDLELRKYQRICMPAVRSVFWLFRAAPGLRDDTGYHLDIDDEALLRKKLRDRLERLKARNTDN